jgi:hypothetical protein
MQDGKVLWVFRSLAILRYPIAKRRRVLSSNYALNAPNSIIPLKYLFTTMRADDMDGHAG